MMTGTTPIAQETWGIIRYAPGSGAVPQEDAAAFDGWYTDREDALAVARDWIARHPQWIVALVRSDLVWFGDGDFSTLRHRPLTTREHGFAKALRVAPVAHAASTRGTVTRLSLNDWMLLCPYGKWTCADGREVLFNRQYRPILERQGVGAVRAADPSEWVAWKTQDYFFDDGDCPWGCHDHHDHRGPRPRYVASLKRVNAVLAEWGVGQLNPPPKPKPWTGGPLPYLDMNEPLTPLRNLWEDLIGAKAKDARPRAP